MKKVHLIDGSGFIHRYYHAFPKFQRSDGVEIGAIRGFAEMLWRTMKVLDASHVAVIMDGGRSYRNEIWPLYKSNRKEIDAELRMQLPMLDAACEAFGVATRRVEYYEADDVIATLSAMVDDEMDQTPPSVTTIHSGDKDFYQLMSPTCRIYDPHPDRKRVLEPADCYARFGVHPHQVICAQSLIGDSTDCVPGVHKIGKVAAAKLLAEHGDLDHVLDAALDGTLRGLNKTQMMHLLEPVGLEGKTGIELARISRKLVTLKLDVPLDFDFDDIVRREPDEGVLNAWLDQMEFRGLAQKIEMQAA